MKISGMQPQDVYKTFMKSTSRPNAAEKSESSEVKTDRVEISTEGASITQARKLADKSGISKTDTDDAVRSKKIEALKNQVQSGNYYVPSAEIAKSIIRGNSLDRKA